MRAGANDARPTAALDALVASGGGLPAQVAAAHATFASPPTMLPVAEGP